MTKLLRARRQVNSIELSPVVPRHGDAMGRIGVNVLGSIVPPSASRQFPGSRFPCPIQVGMHHVLAVLRVLSDCGINV